MSIVEKASLTDTRIFNTVAVKTKIVKDERVDYYKATDKICRVSSL